MTEDRITQCLMFVKDYIAEDKMMFVRDKLKDADDNVLDNLMLRKFHDPTHILLFSLLLGGFGVDRFVIGDTGIGVAKLLLSWATCGIWSLIDIFVCNKRAKELNFSSLMLLL